jgi:hypothetical protein
MTANRAALQALTPEYMLPIVRSQLTWYVENIATDFYSAYHRWFPDRPIKWRKSKIAIVRIRAIQQRSYGAFRSSTGEGRTSIAGMASSVQFLSSLPGAAYGLGRSTSCSNVRWNAFSKWLSGTTGRAFNSAH